ncbi:creatininase family protein, partial [Listeria monocytogenes]
LSKSGVYGDASLATEEKGEQMIELFAEKMTALLLEGYGYLTK